MTSCKFVRNEIQMVFDTKGRLSKTAREHLDVCAECAALYTGYLSVREAVSADADRMHREMGPPDLSFMAGEEPVNEVSALRSRRSRMDYLLRAAAVLAVVLVPVLSYLTYDRIRIRNLVKNDIQSFTDQLYDHTNGLQTSLLETSDFIEDLFADTADYTDYDISGPSALPVD